LNVIKGLTDYSLEMLRNVHQDIPPDREIVSADKTTLDTAVSDLQGNIAWLAAMLFRIASNDDAVSYQLFFLFFSHACSP
jgi:hypothetical protein